MSKKRSSKSVIITILITLIVLGCLTFAGIKFLLPAYANGPNGDVDAQYKVYEIAVKVFPLLVGIVLIVIASMIANSRDDEEDDEDKLPPNSYDKQLFETPSDDPSAAKAEEKVTPEESSEFFSIFDAPSAEKPAEEPAQEEAEAEQPEAAAEESAPEAVKAEAQAEEKVPAAVAAAAGVPADSPVVDAIYALVNKLDDLTDMMSYEEEEDDQDDYEKYSTDEYPEEEEDYYEEGPSPLEEKIDKLCDAISNLASIVTSQSGRPVVVAAPAAAPAAPVAEKPAPAPKAAPAKTETVIKTVEVPVDQEINDFDATDPIQRARIEYDSAKEGFYDITFAFTKADVNSVLVSLSGTGDAFEINGRTVAIIPFLSKAEAVEELDKVGAAYDIIFVDGDDNSSFDDVIAPNL